MPYPTCQLIKIDGVPCGSPALRSRMYCYFHQRSADLYQVRSTPRSGEPIPLDPVRDRLELQVSLTRIIRSFAMGRIDDHRATLLLRGIQTAARNLNTVERLSYRITRKPARKPPAQT